MKLSTFKNTQKTQKLGDRGSTWLMVYIAINTTNNPQEESPKKLKI